MGNLGWFEILLIIIAILLLFGPNKLVGLARGMGSAVTEFKKGMRGDLDTLKKEIESTVDSDKPADKS